MKSIAQKTVILLFVFVCAAWVLRGFQLAWIQTSAGAATTQMQPETAPADPVTCQTTEPAVHSPYLAVAHDAAVKAGFDPLVFTWQIFAESSFNPNAHNRTSGAEGIAQFMPETAAGLGIDPWNPTQALAAAANDDAGHLKQFAEQAAARCRALWRQRAALSLQPGARRVQRWTRGDDQRLESSVWLGQHLAGQRLLGLALPTVGGDAEVRADDFGLLVRRERDAADVSEMRAPRAEAVALSDVCLAARASADRDAAAGR